MSKTGIKIVAEVLSKLQEVRGMLLDLGMKEMKEAKTDSDRQAAKQDIHLAQLLDNAKDAVKDEFAKITLE